MPTRLIRENGSAAEQVASCPAVGMPRELVSGIDTLDMTCKSPASAGLVAELAALKSEAGENRRQAVTLDVGGEFVRVMPTGLGSGYPYALEHLFGRLAVGESRNMPAWKVSPSAEALHAVGPLGAVAFFRSLLEALSGGPVELMVSRLDTHADIADLVITADDVADFVCQARKYAAYHDGDVVQTHWWGPGGDASLRAYDKPAEIAATGRGGYLLELWTEAGYRGEGPVTRVEAQVRRRVLRQMGIATAEQAITRAGEVYVYRVRLFWSDSGAAPASCGAAV
jgi:hypothetical protein